MQIKGMRAELTPHMLKYHDKLVRRRDIRWLPYLVFFQSTNYKSEVFNTDASGFRYSECGGKRYSVVDCDKEAPVSLLVGGSTVFGIGSTCDRWTLPSRLSENDFRPELWLNFSGRSFNSAQELILLVLYQHLLPPIKEIIFFSGFNTLALARLPSSQWLEHGSFFNCNHFFEALNPPKTNGNQSILKRMFDLSINRVPV